jgi:hypothetical protein
MSLDDIVNLTISIESSTVTRAGFGTPLVVDYNTRYSDTRVKTYSSLAGMVADTFATSDPAYQAVSKMLSQNPRPRSVKVGRRTLGPAQQVTFTPTVAASTLYKCYVSVTGGAEQTISFTSSATANSAEVLASLTAALAALSGYGAAGLTAATGSGVVTLTGPATGPKFAVRGVNSNFSGFKDTTSDAGIATDLNAIELEDSDWYGFMSTSKGTAEHTAAAAWVETRRKFFIAGTANKDIKTSATNDLGSTLQDASYTRTALFWNDRYMEHSDAAFLGNWLPRTPGSETMKFKTLTGVTADALTDSELGYLRDKNVNHYISLAGVSIIAEGKTCEGEYMDVIRFVDWLYANIQEEIYTTLTLEAKVPFTDPGVAQIEAAIRSVLQRGIQAGGLARDPAFSVIVPLVADVSVGDKSARELTGVSFTATLAGAIHAVTITGNVSV